MPNFSRLRLMISMILSAASLASVQTWNEAPKSSCVSWFRSEEFAFCLAVDAQLLTLAIDDLHDLVGGLFSLGADVERGAKELLRVVVQIACDVVRAARVEGMPQNHIHARGNKVTANGRSEEHTSELQSLRHLVCR